MQVEKHLEMLGLCCQDQVTGLKGVVTSIGFDLYGCVKAVLHPGMDEKGEMRESQRFDIARLEPLDDIPVMGRPDFAQGYVAEGKKGAAEKPLP